MRELIYCIAFFFSFFGIAQNGIQDPALAFPGAPGGGRFATGGRGNVLYLVDNLGISTSDDVYHPINCNVGGHSHTLPLGNADEFYTGGFFSAVEKSDVGYITFNVSGNIEMPVSTSNISGTAVLFRLSGINGSNKTVFGQSAPQGGITFTNGLFRWGGDNATTDGDNVIIRYIRSRPIFDRFGVKTITDDAHTWALNIYGGDDVMIDHVSLSWAQDKAGGSYITETHAGLGITMIGQTWSHSIFGDSNTGAYTEINPGRPDNPEELVDEITYKNNLIIGVNRTPNMAFDGDGEVYNNIIYNTPFKYTRSYHDIRLNHMGNYYDMYNTSSYQFNWAGPLETVDVPVIHSSGNYLIGTVERDEYSATVNFDGTLGVDNQELWTSMSASPDVMLENTYYSSTQHDFTLWSNTTIETPQTAFADVITDGNVGANRYLDDDGYVQTYQDAIDLEMINAVRNGTDFDSDISRWTLPAIPENTRPGTYDTDYDGMSDAWEIRVYGDLSQSYRGDYDSDGVPNLEEYMNQVDTGDSSPVTPPENPIRARGGFLKINGGWSRIKSN